MGMFAIPASVTTLDQFFALPEDSSCRVERGGRGEAHLGGMDTTAVAAGARTGTGPDPRRLAIVSLEPLESLQRLHVGLIL